MLIRNAQVAHNFFTIACHYCMVPENIQTPTTERIGNSRGVGGGGGQRPMNSRVDGDWTTKSLSKGLISIHFRPEFEQCFSPTWQIILTA